ncbi:MAG TPA: hypothetical protein VJC08_01930 [bacterium]|nr:hypothetical protein [bacterium]
MRSISIFFVFLFCFCFAAHVARADMNQAMLQSIQDNMKELQHSVQSLKMTVDSQNEVIRRQSIQIAGLEKSRETSGQQTQTGAVSTPSGAPKIAGLQGFNPEIGLAGTVQAKLTQSSEDAEGNDTIALKELELNFSQVVDPYSRLDAIITFNDNIEDQNVDIEEAYYTRWGLPLGFTGQIGKFRAKIGKQNLKHLHALDTADYALVIRDFFGEEGLASSGARLQNTIPNPWDIPLEVTGEILRGNNGASFSGVSRRPIFNSHVKTFFELSKDVNLELGWTTLFGDENPPVTELDGDGNEVSVTRPGGQGRYGVKVFGGDATLHWFLPEGKKVKFQNELYFQNRSNLVHVNKDPWGFYSLLDYKFSPKFSTGIRFDYLEPLDVTGQHGQTTGVSPYITFWQSEFADFKLQFSHLEPQNGDGKSDNMIFLQADFLIGAHKHPVQ